MNTDKDAIRINNMTVENLQTYLAGFPSDAKVTIWHKYKEWDCQICCNFDHQIEQNKVQLILGGFIEYS